MNVLHATLSVIGVFFGLFVAWVGCENHFDGRPDLTPVRAISACVLIVYASMQFWLVTNRRVRLVQLLCFPFLYISLGALVEFAGSGYSKRWAPCTAEEAFMADVFYGALLILVIALAVYITFDRGSRADDS